MANWEVKVSTLYKGKDDVETWKNAKEVGSEKDIAGLEETLSSLKKLLRRCLEAGDGPQPAVPVLVLGAVKVRRSSERSLLGQLGLPSVEVTPNETVPSGTSQKSSQGSSHKSIS